MARQTRPKRKKVMHVYMFDEEYDHVIKSSTRAGLTISTFARRVCLGHKVPSREDAQARRELLKVNGDLGRLGGLLKQVITSENRARINALLKDIELTRAELREKIKNI